VSKLELKPYSSLSIFDLEGNELEVIEEGLFEFNPSLQYVSFARNKILHIDENVFKKLSSLSYLNLVSNVCVNDGPIINSALVRQLVGNLNATCINSDYVRFADQLKSIEVDFPVLRYENVPKFIDFRKRI